MCYEESFFRSWATRKAQRREKSETVVERRAPVQPEQPAPVTRPAAEPARRKETEREMEVV
jgi:hypothetical protein